MLELIGTERYKSVSKPCPEALMLAERCGHTPVLAEIGVGVGATTLALAEKMNGRGTIHIFDYQTRVEELTAELASRGFANIVPHGNSAKIFDDYCWALADLLQGQRADGRKGTFDFVYLDGSHTFVHDAPAALLSAELLKPGGYLLFDDLLWTLAKSPTMNSSEASLVSESFTDAQIATAQVRMICDLFFEHDPRFTRIVSGVTPWRALYQKVR